MVFMRSCIRCSFLITIILLKIIVQKNNLKYSLIIRTQKLILKNKYTKRTNKSNDTTVEEGFLGSGDYPDAVDSPILECDYNVKPNPGISDLGAAQISQNYPVFPSDSCANNNIRYWNKPTNGRCTRPEMCGGLYEHTEQNIPSPPPTPIWGKGTRVNFYEYM